MELLLILIYVSICYAVFKIFKIPVNQWSLATAALGGIIGITLILLIMNYNHPFTNNARIYFSVTPVLPTIRGRVIEVPVETNKPLKQGDVLFKIDPKPYQYVLQQKQASLAEAEQNVKQLKAAYDQATAAAERTNAQFDLAQQNYDRQAELFEKGVIAQATLDTFTRNLETARQSLAGARAEQERARLAYTSNIDGVNTSVARLTSEVADAQFDLDQTVMQAPGEGFVTQVALRPGVYVTPLQMRPAMVFVNTEKGDRELGAAFQQNSLQRVKAGDEAEVAFDAVPGRVFKGKVRLVHKDFPVPTHKGALPAAEAARCAAAQGVFWEYHDLLYLAVPDFSRDDLLRYAGRLSLDREAFATCLDTHQFRKEIEADVREGRALKLPGTPTFLVNGKPLVGAQPIEAFRGAIRDALKEAAAR